MNDKLKDYYWGRNIPIESLRNPDNQEWKDLVRKELDLKDKLQKELTREQQTLFHEYLNTLMRRVELDKEELFVFAVQVGSNLQMEMLNEK